MKKKLFVCSLIGIVAMLGCKQPIDQPIKFIAPSSEGLYAVDLTILAPDSTSESRNITQEWDPERLGDTVFLDQILPYAVVREGADDPLSWKYIEPGTLITNKIVRTGYKAVVTKITQLELTASRPATESAWPF